MRFLESSNSQVRFRYAGSSENEKRMALKGFVQAKAGGAKQWATALVELL